MRKLMPLRNCTLTPETSCHDRQVCQHVVCVAYAGSSKLVRGNPTEYYRRAGSGTSVGAGVKLGAVRAEYCTEGASMDKGAFFLRFGERY